MILISSSKLERKIAENALTAWGKTKYIIVYFALFSISPIYILAPSFGPKPPPGYFLVSFLSIIASVFITYFGIKKCYQTNKTFDDAHFIERFMLLSVPTTIKFMLSLLPALFLIAVVATSISVDRKFHKEATSNLWHIVSPIAMIMYYVLINRSFQRFVTFKKMGSHNNSIEANGG